MCSAIYIDNLLENAKGFFVAEGAIPLDIAASLMACGINVETLERKWREEAGI